MGGTSRDGFNLVFKKNLYPLCIQELLLYLLLGLLVSPLACAVLISPAVPPLRGQE